MARMFIQILLLVTIIMKFPSKATPQAWYQPPAAECPYPCLPPPIAVPSPVQNCPPPPSPPSGGSEYYSPPPPSGGSEYYYPPPSSGYYYPPPPNGYYPYNPPPSYGYNSPPPPNPIVPYFPFYFKSPPPPPNYSSAPTLIGYGFLRLVLHLILLGLFAYF